MVKKTKLDANQKKAVAALSDLKAYRTTQEMNQADFWNRYGVSQSAGSRFECRQRSLSSPMAMLMALHHMGVISDEDLARAGAVAAELGMIERVGH